MRAEEKIGDGIRRALERVGIVVTHVEVTDYSPKLFGNHVAHARTKEGAVEVIFDRCYELDLLESRIAPELGPATKRALAREFSAAIRASL